jgi:hypothetical protein
MTAGKAKASATAKATTGVLRCAQDDEILVSVSGCRTEVPAYLRGNGKGKNRSRSLRDDSQKSEGNCKGKGKGKGKSNYRGPSLRSG